MGDEEQATVLAELTLSSTEFYISSQKWVTTWMNAGHLLHLSGGRGLFLGGGGVQGRLTGCPDTQAVRRAIGSCW